jgi:hypothetical protein
MRSPLASGAPPDRSQTDPIWSCPVHASGPLRSRTGNEMSGAESLRSRSPPMKDKRLKKRQDREGRIVDDIDGDEPPGEGAEAED